VEQTQATYTVVGNRVEISRSFDSPIVLDRPNLVNAIENIRNNRHEYGTAEAHQRMLDLYQGALAALDA